MDFFVEAHKHINGHSPGYMSDLLVLNSDINIQNNRNSSLNLVCPCFKHETELRKIEYVHSFKKVLIDFFCIFLIFFVVIFIMCIFTAVFLIIL